MCREKLVVRLEVNESLTCGMFGPIGSSFSVKTSLMKHAISEVRRTCTLASPSDKARYSDFVRNLSKVD